MKDFFTSLGKPIKDWTFYQGSDWIYVFESGCNYQIYYKKIETEEEKKRRELNEFITGMDYYQGME